MTKKQIILFVFVKLLKYDPYRPGLISFPRWNKTSLYLKNNAYIQQNHRNMTINIKPDILILSQIFHHLVNFCCQHLPYFLRKKNITLVRLNLALCTIKNYKTELNFVNTEVFHLTNWDSPWVEELCPENSNAHYRYIYTRHKLYGTTVCSGIICSVVWESNF